MVWHSYTTASASPSCKTLLKAGASEDGNARDGPTTSCPSSSTGVRLWRRAWESSSAFHTGSAKPMSIYRVRSKESFSDRNLSWPLISVGRWHGLVTSHGIIAWYHRKSWSDSIKNWTDMTIPELLRARSSWRWFSVSSTLISPATIKVVKGLRMMMIKVRFYLYLDNIIIIIY